MNKYGFPIAIVFVVAALIGIFVIGNKKAPSTSKSTTAKNWAADLPGLLTGKAPWPANNGATNLQARLNAIGLPSLASEGTALHIHQHLDIFVEGQKIAIPPEIGIASSFISPIHVHDTTGILHVESPTIQTFTLGQAFAIWGVNLTDKCVGGYCSAGDKVLQVYSNGKLISGNPEDLPLTAHEEIVITYGTKAQLPKSIPSNYAFPKGL